MSILLKLINVLTYNKVILDTFVDRPNASSPNGNSPNTIDDVPNGVHSNVPFEAMTLQINMTSTNDKHDSNINSIHNGNLELAKSPHVPPIPLTECQSTSSIDTFYSAVWHQTHPHAVASPRSIVARNIAKCIYRTKPITINTSHLPPPPPVVRHVQTSPRVRFRFTTHNADVCIAEVSANQYLRRN